MFRHLGNWGEVWAAYRTAQRLPPLQFRRGFVLHHGPGDDPILLLHTVFARSEYGALASRRTPYLIDIGANIGSVTLDLAWRDGTLKVDAYEPNPRTFETLTRNVQENGLGSRVRVFSEAVMNRDGVVVLWSGESSVLSSVSASAAIGGVSVSVPTISLDRAVSRTGSAQVALKIDAEGAEVEMLESASEATLAAIAELALEYHDSIVPDARARCHAVLTRAGFVCRTMPFASDQGILVARRPRARVMKRVLWTCSVFWSRWRTRMTYVAAAPRAYRNWWMLPLPKLGVGVVLELRSGLRYNIRPHTTDLGVVNEISLVDPYFGPGHIALPHDAIVLDVGANIGDFTLQAARRCPTGRVFAVEPVGEHVRIISAHLAMNDIRNVTCIHAALGGEDGRSAITNNGSCSRTGDSGTRTEIVPLKTLASLMREQGLERIDLLKMDCEGAEWDILPEAESVLPRVRQICMEFHCERGWTSERLAQWLRTRGYRVWHTPGTWTGMLWAVR
jgi:FkbM family methyltransferase